MTTLGFSGEDAGLPEPKTGAQADPEDRHGGGPQISNRSGAYISFFVIIHQE